MMLASMKSESRLGSLNFLVFLRPAVVAGVGPKEKLLQWYNNEYEGRLK